MTSVRQPSRLGVSQRVAAALMAFALGVSIQWVSGFAPITAVHNAAHDGRHVAAFPCHRPSSTFTVVLDRVLAIAVIAGLVAGLVASAMKMVWTTPLIVETERYERGAAVAVHVAHGHDHDEDGWARADGLERTAFTILPHVLIATGFGLLLSGVLVLRGRGSLVTGLLWGAAGFLAVHDAPALGLPPELPGTEAASLAARQTWWLATVLCTGCGLALLAFGRKPELRLAAPLVIVLPHFCGAPQPEVHAALAREALQREFAVAALLTNGLMWLVLGRVSGFLYDRLIEPAGRRPVDGSLAATMPRGGAGRRR